MTKLSRHLIGWSFTFGLVACGVDAQEPVDDKGEVTVAPADRASYGKVAAVTTGRTLSDADLDHELALRRAWGLSADPARLAALHADPARYGAVRSTADMFGNLLLEPGELEAAVERAELEYHSGAAGTWAEQRLGDRFAGAYLEGRRLVVACARCTALEAADIDADLRAAALPSILRGRVTVREVTFSLAELVAGERKLANASQGLDTTASTFDVIENVLELRVRPAGMADAERARARLEGAAGMPVKLVADSTSDALDAAEKHTKLGYDVVEGGQTIGRTPGEKQCTSGFAVQGAYGPFLLTAGHCIDYPNQVWYQGGSKLGTAAAVQDGGNIDAALISTAFVRNAIGRVHVTREDFMHPVTFAVTSHNILQQTVCQTGWWTYENNPAGRCGIVTRLNFDPDAGGSKYNAAFGEATYNRHGGDSGAAVFWPTAYGYGAAGIHHGAASSNARGSFTRFPLIAQMWGLSLIPY